MSQEARIAALLDRISRETGLLPRSDWVELCHKSLEQMAAERRSTVDALLDEGPLLFASRPRIISELTVGETYFFRHASHFALLADALGERLHRDPQKTAHILSLGCSSGEEAYSAAIALHEALGCGAIGRVRVTAIDINPASIERARAGVYGAWAFREAPHWLQQRYFTPNEPAGHRVSDEIRKMVTFHCGHLPSGLSLWQDGSADAIFFRNVGIYLAKEVIEEAYREFARLLSPDGLLFVAPADPRPEGDAFTNLAHETTSVYQKRTAESEESPRATPAKPSPTAPRAALLPRPCLRGKTLPAPPPARSSCSASPNLKAGARILSAAAALALAEAGDERGALAAATILVETDTTAPMGHFIRGQIALSHGKSEEAANELRRALYLSPEHRLARHLYVLALQTSGREAQALAQARALERMLSSIDGKTQLEDGMTTAEELLRAVEFILEGLE